MYHRKNHTKRHTTATMAATSKRCTSPTESQACQNTTIKCARRSQSLRTKRPAHTTEQPESCQTVCGGWWGVVESKCATCLGGQPRPVNKSKKQRAPVQRRVSIIDPKSPFDQSLLHRVSQSDFRSDPIETGTRRKAAPNQSAPTCKAAPRVRGRGARGPCGGHGS